MTDELVSINSARSLTAEQFAGPSDIPAELERLANITNAKTRRAYKVDVAEFLAFSARTFDTSLRAVTRAHVIAWRETFKLRSLTPATCNDPAEAFSSIVVVRFSTTSANEMRSLAIPWTV